MHSTTSSSTLGRGLELSPRVFEVSGVLWKSRDSDAEYNRMPRNLELRRQVLDSLLASGYPALKFIACETSGNRVILEGRVPSYHLKQLAQVRAQRVDGVGRVENRLQVGRRRA